MLEHRIRTASLELIAGSVTLLEAEMKGNKCLAGFLDAVVPDEWPPEVWRLAAEEFHARLEKHPALAGWLNWYCVLVEGDRRVLVGIGGFTGAPFNGEVMIGYSILEPYQRRGYGVEVVSALARWAFASHDVQRIVAETGHLNEASKGLLLKCGFEYAGKGFEGGTIRYALSEEKWRLLGV
jgi:RimJ/RimL family protein N-acetyltransferase